MTATEEQDLDERLKPSITDGLVFTLVVGAAAALYLKNEVVQQGKHLYYHMRGIPHSRYHDDPETSFSYYVKD